MGGVFSLVKNKKPFKLDDKAAAMNFDLTPTKRRVYERPPITIRRALEMIFRQLLSLGRRPRTIESYDYIFTNFTETMGIKYVHEIDADAIYDYMEQLDVALTTKQIRLKTIKAILSRFYDNDLIAYKFWTNIQIKVDTDVKEEADARDIALLLHLIDKTTFTGFRDAVAILLLYRTGIRINTLGELREKHIDFDELELILDGSIMKGRSLLKLPIDEQIADNLKRLIIENDRVRKHYGIKNDYVFITSRGVGINTTGSNTNVISRQLTNYSKIFNLKNINSHAIRRAYAKNLLKDGANIALISKALGHKDLSTTTRYLHLDVDEVAQELREFL